MIRPFLSWLSSTDDNRDAGDARETSDDPDTGESDDSVGGFLLSRLDASVLLSHGGPRPERRADGENQISEAEHDALEAYHRRE